MNAQTTAGRWKCGSEFSLPFILILGICLASILPGHAAAILQGQSFGSTNWITGNLSGWKELDFIPFRIHLTAGPASNQTYTVEFDHTKTAGGVATPGIQDLFNFVVSSNITILSGPTLSAPPGSDTWSYSITVDYTTATEGSIEFRARLAAGAHNFTGSSLALKGSGSLGLVQITKPGATTGFPDLSVSKVGPASANPGQVITYVLNYSNSVFASIATGVQVRDVLPPLVAFVGCSGGCDLTGNTITWDLGTVGRGARGTLTYQVIVTNTAQNGQTLENSAAIFSAENDANPGDNTDSVITTITGACVPPAIAADPVSTTNCPASPATFAVVVNGTSLQYQWRKNGTNIAGANADTYVISSISDADTGFYDVVVTNICGNVTSLVATLTIYEPTTADPIASQTNCAGATVTFATLAHGEGPFLYQWFKDGTPLLDETNSSLARTNISAADAGEYAVRVTGLCNSVTNLATLAVNAPTTASDLVSLTVCPGEPMLFSTIAGGTGPFTYQWFKDGSPLLVETNSSLIVNSASAADAGTYCVAVVGACGSVTNCATLTVGTNVSASALTDLTLCPAQPATFSTMAEGSGPFTYQWTFNGTNINDATNSSFSIPAVVSGDAGTYCVVVTSPCGAATNCATLRVLASAIAVTYRCPDSPVAPGELLFFTGSVSNSGDAVLTNVVVSSTALGLDNVVFGPATLNPGESAAFTNNYRTPADSCGPWNETLSATAVSTCGVTVSNSVSAACPAVTAPSIVVTKHCPAEPVAPDALLFFTGSVSNSGNISLTNVMVVNDQPTAGTLVFGPATLAPGEVVVFTNSYLLPSNFCGPASDTLVVTAASLCGSNLSHSASASCPVVTSPAIHVAKTCPEAPVAPGELLNFSGSVSNAGNVSLTNIFVVNDQPSNNTPILGPIALAPGESVAFSGSYRVPLDQCGPWIDTVSASATSICGSNVSHSASASCPAITTPGIRVTKSCPSEPVAPGAPLVFFGSVSNTGNITLTNVVVVNDQPSPGTLVVGPLTLAPGEVVLFTNSYAAPLNTCGPANDTLTASATSLCGSKVSHSASASCLMFTTPGIFVTKNCPPTPTSRGGLLVWTGSVSNSGDITLTNVVVVDDQPSPNTPIVGPITLLPGETVLFTNSFSVPADACVPIADTLLATATSLCGSNVSHSATIACPLLIQPAIRVAKICPPVPVFPGAVATFTSSVSNSGFITLTNVVVVNNQPTNNTLLIGPITLEPGEVVFFTNSYTAPFDRCLYVDTLTATARSTCGQDIVHRATAICLPAIVPGIEVTKECPSVPAGPGELFIFTGTVRNSGNVSITNVVVVNNQPASNTVVFGPVTLEPFQSVSFTNSYLVPTNYCGPLIDTLTATARTICGTRLTNSFTATCSSSATNCPGTLVLTPSRSGNQFVITFTTEQGKSYSVERTDSLTQPIVWAPHTNVIGTGFPTNIFDHATNEQRYFRVVY